jgi:predicted amidohydrolase
MKVTLVQTSLFWEDRQKNLEHFDRLLAKIDQPTNLIVLPEMFTTGFTMNPEKLAEPADGPAVTWLKEKAKEKNCVITGSVSVKDGDDFYNRLFWVEPSGAVSHYNKRHLFRMAKEDEHYAMGNEKLIRSVSGFNVCPLVCYDLRFPVWCRNTFTKTGSTYQPAYDVLVFVANWPEVRSYPWKQLLIARAIENQCYVVGVNRVGADGNNIAHCGDSMVINPRGEIISKTEANQENIETIELSQTYLEEFRRIFPVGLDADDFTLR